ncbi:MAG: hypothetical protein ACO29L_04350 [Candidatus Methylopumilus sp.]
MKLHQKGYLLVSLSKADSMWDHALIAQTFEEYGSAGEYAENTIRIALDELAAGGLINRLEEKLEIHNGKQKLFFKYQLSAFGRSRMQDTGLLS